MTFLALPCDAVPGRVEWDKTDRLDNIRAMYFKAVFSPNGYAYAGLEYKGLDVTDKKAVADDLLRQVKEYKKVGYDGMKMYEGHPNHRKLLGYPLYDEVFDKYFDYCEKIGYPIIMHLANPAHMWDESKVDEYWRARGCFFDDTYLAFDQFHEEIFKRLDKNPKLNFTLALFNGEYGHYSNDINFNDGSLYVNDAVTFTALTNVKVDGEFTTVSEYKNANVATMYAIMNMIEGKYASDSAAYQTTTLTFADAYTHVILWRNGEKKLVALDENHCLEIENAAGEAAYVIPYTYKEHDGLFADDTDNGIFFPGGEWSGNAW